MGILPICDFITSDTSPSENADFLNVDAFMHITTSLMEKIFKYWKAIKLIVVDTYFPKF